MRSAATWSMVIAGIDADPAKAPELRKWAEGLLGGRPSVQRRRRIRQFHDGRRGRGAHQGQLWRQL